MPSIKKLSDIHRTVIVPIEDETVTVTYRLGAFHTEFGAWIEDHGEDRGSLLDWIMRVVTQWDIEDEGKTVPVTRVAMEKHLVPTPILYLIKMAIDEDRAAPNLRMAYTSRSLDLKPTQNGTQSS